jgi:trimethylamine--corrinoid protein Co-methyltransferase
MNWTNISDRETNDGGITHLSDEQFQMIHAASLEILDGIGVQLHLEEAVDLLKKAGAKVTDGNLVHVPPKLVESALSTVPKEVTLYDRSGNPVMPLGGKRCFFGPGSDCLNIIDHRTGERREPILQDVIDGATICDGLSNIDFVMSMVLPTDVDKSLADTYQIEAILNHTTKPVIIVSYETEGLEDAVAMAEAIVGGAEALRQKPIITCYINVVSGRVHNADGLQKLLYLSGKGLPSIYIPASNAGVTSPMTLAGAVAFDNAGVLLGVVLSQLNREGAPMIISAMNPISLDMKTMVGPYAFPEKGFMRSVAQRYGVPTFSLAGVSDSKVVDQQAAAEAALTILVDVLMGGNIIHDLGYLESGLTYSFAQLTICDQIVDWVKTFFKGIEVNDETLALEDAARVGINDTFLKTKHTRKHYRNTWYPELFERGNYSDWERKGSKPLAARAAMRVQEILNSHHPEPLSDDIQMQIKEIVEQRVEKSRS